MQGALAAACWAAAPASSGVTEDCGRFLDDVLQAQDTLPTDDAGWDALALTVVQREREAGRFVPGLGHHVHKDGDPRTPRLMQIAAEEDQTGPHLSLFAAIGRVHPQVLGKTLPLNGARRVRRGAGRPRPAAAAAARVRPAGPHRRADRPAGRGAAAPGANDIFLSVDLNNRSVAPDPS